MRRPAFHASPRFASPMVDGPSTSSPAEESKSDSPSPAVPATPAQPALGSGKALAVGGYDGGPGSLTSAELYTAALP